MRELSELIERDLRKIFVLLEAHHSCTALDLRNLRGQSAAYGLLKVLLGRKLIKRKRFPGENFYHYFLASQKHLRKRKPVLTPDQQRVLRAAKSKPGSDGWEIRRLAGGEIPVSSHLLYLVQRKLLRKGKGIPPCYYPV